MKRTILTILTISVCLAAAAQTGPQLTNGDFETWTYDGANLPNNWNSFQTADGKYASEGYSKKDRQVERSTDTRPGSTGRYSCRIWSRKVKILGVTVATAQGNLTTGRIHAAATKATSSDNYNYSDRDGSNTNKDTKVTNPCAMKFTGKPDSLVAWIKFVPKGVDSDHPYAMLNAYIHDDVDYIAGFSQTTPSSHLVAKVEKEISTNGGKWQRVSVPFVYGSNTNPQYILINISTNGYPGAGNEGDVLYVDDIEMIYNKSFNLSIPSSNGWATLCVDFNAEIPSGAKAYIATAMESGYVKLKEIPAGQAIPANTAVLVSSSTTSLTIKQSGASKADVSGNILSGSVSSSSKDSGYDYYVLSADATTPKAPSFAKYSGSSLAANKGYIKVRK